MKKIKIEDQFKVDDSHSAVKGFVIARNEDGKIVFKKQNMIVKYGRQQMFKRINYEGQEQIFPRLYPVFGDSDVLTTPDMILSSSTINSTFGALSDADVSVDDPYIDENTMTVLFNVTKKRVASALGLRCMGLLEMKQATFAPGANLTNGSGLVYKKEIYEVDGVEKTRFVRPAETTAISGTDYYLGCLFSRVTFPPYPDSAQLSIEYTFYF